MTFDEAIADIQRGMGYRTDLSDEIVLELNKRMRILERRPVRPWFLLSEWHQTVLEIGEQRVQLPSDFLFEYEEGMLYIYDEEDLEDPWKELTKDDEDFLRQYQLGDGPPEFYSIAADYIVLFPVPDDEYIIKMKYYKKDAAITTGAGTNLWLTYAPDLLIAETGYIVAANIQNAVAMGRFREERAEASARFLVENESRMHDNRRYVMGGDD